MTLIRCGKCELSKWIFGLVLFNDPISVEVIFHETYDLKVHYTIYLQLLRSSFLRNLIRLKVEDFLKNAFLENEKCLEINETIKSSCMHWLN